MTTEQDVVKLQQDIERLNREIKLYRDPFSRSEQLRLEQGTTGAAKIRRIPMYFAGTHVTDTHNGIASMTHLELADAATTTIFCTTVPIPIDYVPSLKMTINWLYSSAAAGGDVSWLPYSQSYKSGGTAPTILTNTTTHDAAPATANTLGIGTRILAKFPEKDEFLSCFIRRVGLSGSDSNTGEVSLYSVWFEYIAFI